MTKTLINRLKTHRKNGHVFRFQPSGANISEYSSISYGDEENVDGVWAFQGLMNTIRNIYSSESYVDDIDRDGFVAELVVLSGNIEDGPEDFVIVNRPVIVERFEVKKLLKETDPFFNKDENELCEYFLDSLEGD